VRFIPVKLDAVNCTIFKANGSNAFELAPASCAECFPQTGNLTYPFASSNQFDFFNLTDDLEVFIYLLNLSYTTQINEELCRVVCHILCVLIQSIFELVLRDCGLKKECLRSSQSAIEYLISSQLAA
jgi:hypothetical protein